MRRAAWVALLAWTLSAPASAERLTLEEALASVTAPHPDRRIAESELALARADREQAASGQDFSLYLDGALRSGLRPADAGPYSGEWRPDNIARVVARKPLFDFGRTRQAVAAADKEVAARQEALYTVESLRRIDIMARFFDVLMADRQYAADNEFMAVAYVAWDNAKDRFEVGQISRPDLLKLETEYQDIRERRNSSEQRSSDIRTFPLLLSGARTDGQASWDLTILKEFSIRERVKWQFRAEAYNALNHTNLSKPNTSPTNSSFGMITGTDGDARNWQFALKMRF